jgi:enterochelin esterase-like enzyme
MKKIILLILISTVLQAQEIKVSSGKVIRLNKLSSAFITSRNVDIWLPNHYSNEKSYAVIYMHDGQMLFDGNETWNKQEWGVDEAATALMEEGRTRDFIVVGIWNIPESRHADYFPQKPLESLSATALEYIKEAQVKRGGTTNEFKSNADAYLKFIVTELKPLIDKTFNTKTDAQNTFMAGSSMGGLISIYALCEYPEIFGGVACMSTHWPGIFAMEKNPIPQAFYNYLKNNLPSPETHKIYFDHGTATLDAMYPPLQAEVDVIMKDKGFDEDSWLTLKFEGADHSENAWRERLHLPLTFLLSQE